MGFGWGRCLRIMGVSRLRSKWVISSRFPRQLLMFYTRLMDRPCIVRGSPHLRHFYSTWVFYSAQKQRHHMNSSQLFKVRLTPRFPSNRWLLLGLGWLGSWSGKFTLSTPSKRLPSAGHGGDPPKEMCEEDMTPHPNFGGSRIKIHGHVWRACFCQAPS